MFAKIFIIIINLIVNTIKLNSMQIGIMRAPIINPNGKFYDFINASDENEKNSYSKINLTDCKNVYFNF